MPERSLCVSVRTEMMRLLVSLVENSRAADGWYLCVAIQVLRCFVACRCKFVFRVLRVNMRTLA